MSTITEDFSPAQALSPLPAAVPGTRAVTPAPGVWGLPVMAEAVTPGLTSSPWMSLPFPVLCETEQGTIVEVNEAFAQLLGLPRAQFTGTAVAQWQPSEDRALHRHLHDAVWQAAQEHQHLPPHELRFIHATGDERWCRVWLQPLETGRGSRGLLWLMQDSTEERRARAQADRSLDELAQWFELSPSGKVVYDDSGLVLRSNAVFEAWVGGVPVTLVDASPAMQRLLGWSGSGVRSDLRPGLPVIETVAELEGEGGRVTRLTARLRAVEAGDGRQRVMAVVLDISAEAERDRAQLEVGALMSAAGVGVATFESQGALPLAGMATADSVPALPSALPDFRPEWLEPVTHGVYQRLRDALRAGQSAEGRYAVRHPERGLRWLLTRVEPALLRSGRQATSVVTLDITEQELTRQHGDELLRELTTILDGSPVGIAYLRDGRLVRCNLRFERMLGFEPGASAGLPTATLFDLCGSTSPGVEAALQALAQGRACDIELPVLRDPEYPEPVRPRAGVRRWYALSVRAAESHDSLSVEAVAVLADITGLKRQQAAVERALHERELMFNQSDVGIVWLRAGRILRANAAMSDLTGLSAPELAGLDIQQLQDDSEAAAHERDVRLALATRGRYVGERRLHHRDGSRRWTQLAVRAVDAADPQSDLICSFVDVDERQRARESLQQLAVRTRAVLDSVLVGIVTVGDQGIEWMNRSARRMFAGELEDFVGAPIGTVATHEADHPLLRTDWLQRLADGESEIFECRLKARDGRQFWVVGNAVATPRDLAVGRQVTFALLDIEARRQAEVRISGARASLQRLIETAPLAIALFDATTLQIVESNQAAEAFFGRPAQALLGASPEGCFADADQAAALRASLDLARETPEGVRREITRPASQGAGTQRWDTRFVNLSEPGSRQPEAGQVLLVASDVTELRLAEQARLDAAIAQREMLVKEVHHRIKNNLQGVAGLLQQTAQRRPEVQLELQEAIGQVQAIAQVYGLQVGAAGPLDLVGVLSAVAGSVQRGLHHVIEVTLEQPVAVRWMLPEGESIPLALTLNELLTNAVKHGDQRAVRCKVQARSEDVLIEISNGGQLPPGFDLKLTPTGMYGLGLVRALLPRRAATLDLHGQDDRVVAALTLKPPSVRRPPS
ncbi:MAG: PAS domain S-box protein [Rubrivivax sp.]|nr:PAS domain S-box protein [Rubrivivax sp.]